MISGPYATQFHFKSSLERTYGIDVRKGCSRARTETRKRVPNQATLTGRWPRSHGNPCHALRHSKTGRSVEPAQPAVRALVLRPHTSLQRHGLRHKETHVDVLRAAARRREVIHDQGDTPDSPAARCVMRKDRCDSKTPVAERDHRTRLRALTRETREAAAWWPRHRSNEGFLLGKSCHVSEWPLAYPGIWTHCSHKVM